MAIDCNSYGLDQRTILDIAYQKRAACGLGPCDAVLGGTSQGLKRGRYSSGAHECTLIAAPIAADGSVLVQDGIETFGTAGQGDPGTPMGLTWRTKLTYSDTDSLQGGAFQQSVQFLVVGVSVQWNGAAQVTDTDGTPANTEVLPRALSRAENAYDRLVAREFMNHAFMFVQTPDNECIMRLDTLDMLPASFGTRNSITAVNGKPPSLWDFTPLMIAYCAGSSFRNNPTWTVQTARQVYIQNDISDTLTSSITLDNGETPQTLLNDGAVYARYLVVWYGFPVLLPENVCAPVS